MSHVSRKLKGTLGGALAGGGDPATSPLYVFGPFLRLLAAAGVTAIAFGAAIWMVVLTVVTVSMMYRLVMGWITDGSGGSGLNEEEFGSWAVKLNAGITVIEYTLTFLVSLAALVTFVADRFPSLAGSVLGVPIRTLLARGLSLIVGYAVNRGPRVAARAFGPATAGVLLLLWAWIVATFWRYGLRLPELDLRAFAPENLHFTLGGYARILALMTGIEIFANLVSAYEGPARDRSRKAFGSLAIVMGTTSLTMLVVGPAILELSDPFRADVSVFTQTMDRLLPAPLPYLGTLVGVAVLLSAAAASAQGLQNLALGLRYRNYLPGALGRRNRFEVADKPVWIEVAIVIACFAAFGTHEETYLALYAAGVFILLGLTGWATVKRLLRELHARRSIQGFATLGGAFTAALLTTLATLVFGERFREGAWLYLVLTPALFGVFTFYRVRLGAPTPVEERLGSSLSSSYLPPLLSEQVCSGVSFRNILVPLDLNAHSQLSLVMAQAFSRAFDARIRLLHVRERDDDADGPRSDVDLADLAEELREAGCPTELMFGEGDIATAIGRMACDGTTDLVVMAYSRRSLLDLPLMDNVVTEVIHQTTPPLIVVRPTEDPRSIRSRFRRLLVALDGSEISEQILPHVHAVGVRFRSEIVLLSVLEGSESDAYPERLRAYVESIAGTLTARGHVVRASATGSGPVATILRTAREERADLLMMVTHGRGGLARQKHVKLGSVVEGVLEDAPCPVFVVSAVTPPSRR